MITEIVWYLFPAHFFLWTLIILYLLVVAFYTSDGRYDPFPSPDDVKDLESRNIVKKKSTRHFHNGAESDEPVIVILSP